MKRKHILLITSLIFLITLAVAMGIISSYDSITGYATVEESITLDIIGSSNDENYTLKDVHQGETKYSPKIKIVNHADVEIDINFITTILPGSAGNESDVTLSIVDKDKNNTLENPITIPTDNLYIYVKHVFEPDANVGDYFFGINASPV